MNSLRNRIAALLIVSILAVVGMATLIASQLLERPLPETSMIPVARQINLLAQMAQIQPEAAAELGLAFTPTPAEGDPDPRGTELWMRILRSTGMNQRAVVRGAPSGSGQTISVELTPQGWLTMPLPDMRPPRGGPRIFAGWMGLITLGAALISVLAATRITGPLRLLEGAADRIGTDGLLAPIPETGLPETRATAQALNRLSSRLKTAMESRMRLVAAAGHDLRTPMTRMRLRAEFIEDDTEREKWLADLAELDSIADSAIRLVREEAQEHGEVTEPLRLDRLLPAIATELGALGYPVTAGAMPALSVRAAPLALKRALRNLIINAATHGGGAELALSQDRDRVRIDILDRGPGIPQALMDKAFEPFFRVDPGRRKSVPGVGLGMAISREIVQRFDGDIALAGRVGGGLAQCVTLPLAQP